MVARANAHVRFPARVQLVAAMNPCGRVALLMSGVKRSCSVRRPDVERRNRDTLGGRLARKRDEVGLSQTEAAKRIGVSVRSLRYWEADERPPTGRASKAVKAFLVG